MKSTVAGGYKNLRGQRVQSRSIIGGVLVGTVITHIRDNKWLVQFDGCRVTLKRNEFTLAKGGESC
ncbi:MAG: hypothetical protein RLZZ373_856 [Pseudomonadota bacterium]|jgi:hypothetical protein